MGFRKLHRRCQTGRRRSRYRHHDKKHRCPTKERLLRNQRPDREVLPRCSSPIDRILQTRRGLARSHALREAQRPADRCKQHAYPCRAAPSLPPKHLEFVLGRRDKVLLPEAYRFGVDIIWEDEFRFGYVEPEQFDEADWIDTPISKEAYDAWAEQHRKPEAVAASPFDLG